MAFNTQWKRFQAEVQKKAVHRRRNRAQITHQLGSSLSDVSFFSELLCIDNAVIGFIRLCQAVIFMAVGIPVEVTAVDNGAAYLNGMSVHIFGGGVGNDICTPLEGTAVYRCGKGVIHNKRHAVLVCNVCKFLDIKNYQSRIGDSFCKENLCVRFECGSDLFFCCIGINKGAVNAKFLEGDGKKVEGSSVNGRSGNNVIACLTDIKYCVEVGCLSGRSQDRSNTAFQICDLCGYGIVSRVLETGVKISVCLQIK